MANLRWRLIFSKCHRIVLKISNLGIIGVADSKSDLILLKKNQNDRSKMAVKYFTNVVGLGFDNPRDSWNADTQN